MSIKEPVPLDLKTVSVVKEVLEDAWYSLSAEQQATMSKTTLAERILVSAASAKDMATVFSFRQADQSASSCCLVIPCFENFTSLKADKLPG